MYRIAEVTDVVESSKVYALGKYYHGNNREIITTVITSIFLDGGDGGPRSQTNKALKLKIGERSRDFRFAFISNTPWTDT